MPRSDTQPTAALGVRGGERWVRGERWVEMG